MRSSAVVLASATIVVAVSLGTAGCGGDIGSSGGSVATSGAPSGAGPGATGATTGATATTGAGAGATGGTGGSSSSGSGAGGAGGGVDVDPSGKDFAAKCVQPGVIGCWGFDDPAAMFYWWPEGTSCDQAFAGKDHYTISLDRSGPGNAAAIVQNGQCYFPELDTTIVHSGASALKFTIPSNSDANSSGYFTEVFERLASGDFGYVGPGSPHGNVVYFQFYQYLDSAFLDTDFDCSDGGCGGFKQVIWYGNPPFGSSSSSIEVTHNNGWQRGVPQMYGQQGSDDYGVQDVAGCTFSKATSQGGSGSGFDSRPNYMAPLNPTCVNFVAGQWMQFTVRVEIKGQPNDAASRVQLWVDGQLAIDHGQARINWASDDGDGLGQFQITPYHTNKDPSQSHPVGHTWYDDVIVSTQPIAM